MVKEKKEVMLSPTVWKILEVFVPEPPELVCYMHRTAQQLCLLSAPSGTSWAICTGTLRT